jgi:hypothetical protein
MNTYKTTRSKNICKEGNSYRFRKMINGKKVTRNFRTLREAIAFKNTLKIN